VPNETCLYRRPKGRFIEIRLDRVQLCSYDRCAAALMQTFAAWTDWRIKSAKKGEEPWVYVSKRQLRDDLMGIFGEPSIERGIRILSSLGVLRIRQSEKICGATWYLFDYEKANQLLQAIPEESMDEPARHPNRRNGWKAAFGNNAEGNESCLGNNAEGPLGNNAEGASAIMPTKREPIKREPFTKKKQDPETKPAAPSQPASNAASPMLDSGVEIDRKTGEPFVMEPPQPSWKKNGVQKGKKIRGLGLAAKIRQQQEPSTPPRIETAGPGRSFYATPSLPAPVASPQPSTGLPERWNAAFPDHQIPVDTYRISPAYRKPEFAEQFDAVLEACRKILDAGGDFMFATLLKYDKERDVYGWQKVLAGEFNWMTKKKGGTKTKMQEMFDNMDETIAFWDDPRL